MEATAHHQRHRRCPSCALVGLGKVYIPSSKDCGKVLLLQCTPVRNRTLCNSRHAPKDVVGQCCWTLCGAGYFSRLPLGSGATPNDANHTSNDSAHERRRSVASPAKKSSLRVKSSWSFRGVVAMNELGSLLHHRRRELAISQGWPRLRSARDPGFRIVSYNILAQGLVFRFATDPQIKAFPAALDEAYRWTLLFDQIRGMQADIVCLQEVGARTWQKFVHAPSEHRTARMNARHSASSLLGVRPTFLGTFSHTPKSGLATLRGKTVAGQFIQELENVRLVFWDGSMHTLKCKSKAALVSACVSFSTIPSSTSFQPTRWYTRRCSEAME